MARSAQAALPLNPEGLDIKEIVARFVEAGRTITCATTTGETCSFPGNEWDNRNSLAAAIRALPLPPRPADSRGWQPIETAPRDGTQITCGHDEKRWVRFGRFLQNRWYYSGTSERSQYAQVEGDDPTHWQPLPPPPSKEG